MRELRSLLLWGALACSATQIHAQDPPVRASLRSNFPRGATSDVWAEGSIALMCGRGANRIDVFDVSDPDEALLLSTWKSPEPNHLVSTQDVKLKDGIAYVGLEGRGQHVGPACAQIVDLRDPTNPSLLSSIVIPGLTTSHNLFFDEGWLYLVLCDTACEGLGIVDLTQYDADAPPDEITAVAYVIGSTEHAIDNIHDVTVQNGVAWLSNGDGELQAYDVSDLSHKAPVLLGTIRGGEVHSSWPSADGAYVITCEESVAGPARLFEVVRDDNSMELIQRDSFVNTFSGPCESANPHNPLVLGNRIYLANNAAGVTCLQLDRNSHTWEKTAAFDTSTRVPTNFFGEGCWGVYPFLGHDKILASDRQNGLFVIDFSGLELRFTDQRPRFITPSSHCISLDIRIKELGTSVLDAGSVEFRYRIEGGALQIFPMTLEKRGVWRTFFPSLQIGQRVDYSVVASDTSGVSFTRPGSPTSEYTAYGTDGLTTVFADDFETDKGWMTMVSPPSTAGGLWERGVPVDNGAQPPSGDPDAPGDACYVTEIGIGGDLGDDDVDAGSVILTSPLLDFSGGDGLIQYQRWFFTDDANTPESEPFRVEVTNDHTNWVLVEAVLLSAGGWKLNTFRVSDYVTPNDQVQVRFLATDDPDNTIVEAGLDSFRAARFSGATTPTLRNGTGINPTCYSCRANPTIGSIWRAEVNHADAPGTALTRIVFCGAAASGRISRFGELLVDLGSGLLARSVVPSSGTVDLHPLPIPLDATLLGTHIASQAVLFGSAGIVLTNAMDLVVGSPTLACMEAVPD